MLGSPDSLCNIQPLLCSEVFMHVPVSLCSSPAQQQPPAVDQLTTSTLGMHVLGSLQLRQTPVESTPAHMLSAQPAACVCWHWLCKACMVLPCSLASPQTETWLEAAIRPLRSFYRYYEWRSSFAKVSLCVHVRCACTTNQLAAASCTTSVISQTAEDCLCGQTQAKTYDQGSRVFI